MFRKGKGKTEKYARDVTHVSAGESKKETFSHLLKSAMKSQKRLESGVLESRVQKQKIMSLSSVCKQIRESVKSKVLQGSWRQSQQRSVSR